MNRLLHGNDYNPEQWLSYPGVIDEDFRLLKLAHLNSISIGIFSWATLEPEEGKYDFSVMDDVFDRASQSDIEVILSTPSGGKPNWLACKYPEVRRVNKEGRRDAQMGRHNHCLTSPVYREKVHNINAQLAQRYGKHPNLALWHISNEFSGYCHCELCKNAFRGWLRAKYQSLQVLNETYWARFWSHTFTEWDQIDYIDETVNGLLLDWRRFMTHQCASFIRNEAEPLRVASPHIPVTTNLMGLHNDYNQWELAKELDVVSWDSYPFWHVENSDFNESEVGLLTAFNHDVFRSLKGGLPFLLMETTPSQVNWTKVSPLRRPGVHRLNCLQAIAHGSDAVCYFQFRKSRGSIEQHHGAVVDHVGHENTRVFREVTELGICLEKIAGVVGAKVPAKVALVFDWENRWVIDGAASPQNQYKQYAETVMEHYRPFWERGVAVDIVDSTANFENYTVVIAPMLHVIRENMGEKLAVFVEKGGTLVTGYQTGITEQTGLCILGGVPGPLRKVLGIWVEEFDALPESFRRDVVASHPSKIGLSGTYKARHYFDLLHSEGAEVLATYGEDFYAGFPAVTLNRFGKGNAYYIASRNDRRFQDDFFGHLIRELSLPHAGDLALPKGVTAHSRVIAEREYIFLLNFTAQPARINLTGKNLVDLETQQMIEGSLDLNPFGSHVFLK